MSTLYRVPKNKPQTFVHSPNIDRFSKFFTDTFCEIYVIEWLYYIPPHHNGVATVIFENLYFTRW